MCVQHGSREGRNVTAWQNDVFDALKEAGVQQIGYVPDAGHAIAIRRAEADPSIRAVVLTTEEEGVALAAGAWLGGQRAALLMQSSGVGNTINMLSLAGNLRMPFLTLVTMRGEWGEFNPWQVPMGTATQAVLGAMGVLVRRADHPAEAGLVVRAAADLAFGSSVAVAVLLSQRLIGAKVFVQKPHERVEGGWREAGR
ncbi:MAG: phosphonopyruvate decarboxylase [Rhodospirillales bacterium]|nr:phosphonopyruvate decarboxylase [Rhodospirillales bacterium]